MFPFKLPLVLDGATGTALAKQGLTAGECAAQYILSHPEQVRKLQRGYVAAGADCLYTPTFTAGEVFLSEYGLADKTEEFTMKLTALCKESAGENTLVGGCMGDFLLHKEEISPGEFLAAVEQYARQARYFKQAGVDFLVAESMVSLASCRAAALGALPSGLPLFITVYADFEDEPPSPQELCTPRDNCLLSMLITLQEMGVAAFGVNCHRPQNSEALMAALSPYAKIPLICKPAAGAAPGGGISPREFAGYAEEAVKAGAQMAGGCCGTDETHIAALKKQTDSFDFSSLKLKKEPAVPIAADANQLYFLYENAIFSPPLVCSVDMSEEILEAENSGADVLRIALVSGEDAWNFAENAYMAKLPVCFSAARAEFLVTALSLYHGRAMVDSRSGIDVGLLGKIVAPYGALVY